MRGSMPVKFFYIFDKVENTSLASHRGLPTVTQWTHLIKKNISRGIYIYIFIYIPSKLNYTELRLKVVKYHNCRNFFQLFSCIL